MRIEGYHLVKICSAWDPRRKSEKILSFSFSKENWKILPNFWEGIIPAMPNLCTNGKNWSCLLHSNSCCWKNFILEYLTQIESTTSWDAYFAPCSLLPKFCNILQNCIRLDGNYSKKIEEIITTYKPPLLEMQIDYTLHVLIFVPFCFVFKNKTKSQLVLHQWVAK